MDFDNLIIIAIIAFSIFSTLNKKKGTSKKGFLSTIFEEIEKESKRKSIKIDFKKLNNIRKNQKEKKQKDSEIIQPETGISTLTDIIKTEPEKKESTQQTIETNLTDENKIREMFLFKELIDKPKAYRKHRQ